ncbi:hypothetical protein [Parvularcula maris]|uniref:Uncharacterized protein n=1 Tax=Parvularcula maris TaxID=2965077 RepID=A0A9X2LBD3_9PROT|nr:hypothetical protein [Parvularcula maris]MCQ8185422.1 hypothetical protein [Parvularcula maris]
MLYAITLALVFACGFGLPFATKKMSVALVFLAAAVVLFVGAIPMANFANEQSQRSIFLVVLAFSVLPFAAGALARVISLAMFADKDKEWVYVLATGAVTTVVFLGLGTLLYGGAVI